VCRPAVAACAAVESGATCVRYRHGLVTLTVVPVGVKARLSLTPPGRHVGAVEVRLHSLLTSALDVGGWSTSRPGRFVPGRDPQHPLHRSLGGPQCWSGRFGEETVFCLYRDSNPGRTGLGRILVSIYFIKELLTSETRISYLCCLSRTRV
jgi:hypothetical protein